VMLVLLAVRKFRWPVTAVVAGIFLVMTVQRNAMYASDLSIWSDTAAKRPGNARAQVNLGAALVGRGRLDEALAHFGYAVQLKPRYADAHYNLGVALAVTGETDHAIKHLRTTVELEPGNAQARLNLARLLVQAGFTNEARQVMEGQTR